MANDLTMDCGLGRPVLLFPLVACGGFIYGGLFTPQDDRTGDEFTVWDLFPLCLCFYFMDLFQGVCLFAFYLFL